MMPRGKWALLAGTPHGQAASQEPWGRWLRAQTAWGFLQLGVLGCPDTPCLPPAIPSPDSAGRCLRLRVFVCCKVTSESLSLSGGSVSGIGLPGRGLQ